MHKVMVVKAAVSSDDGAAAFFMLVFLCRYSDAIDGKEKIRGDLIPGM